MNRDRTSSSNDPTAEPAADQSTQSASGIGRRPEAPGVEPDRDPEDEGMIDRAGPVTTPRRYEQPVEQDDSVMPVDDATLNTKI
jgi:hypothetical protein